MQWENIKRRRRQLVWRRRRGDGQEGCHGEGIFEFSCEHGVEAARRSGGEQRAGLCPVQAEEMC